MNQEQIIDKTQERIVGLLVSELVEALIARLPFFALPVINPVTAKVLYEMIDYLFVTGRLFVNRADITLQIKKEETMLNKAAAEARKVKRHGTKEQIQKADAAIIDAARDLIRFGRKRL